MNHLNKIIFILIFATCSLVQAQDELGVVPTSEIEDVEKPLKLIEMYVPTPPDKLAESFEKRILTSLEKDKPLNLSTSFSQILKLRPDPNQMNDNLRWKIINYSNSDEERDFARGRLTELSSNGKISNFDIFILKLKGFYGRTQSLLIISCFAIIIASCLLLFLLPGYVALLLKSAVSVILPGNNNTKKRYHQTEDLGDDEYTRLLKQLGLDEKATENQIKKAYRDAVKSLHPDLKSGNTDGQDDLIKLKALYDRILEIRGSWFGAKRN